MASVNSFSIATRGSALALAQSNMVREQCRKAFPGQVFELNIIKTTGDKLQTASLAQEATNLPKGLFTKELEVALLQGKADFAVHSLKDLPTDLPGGLELGAVGEREDVRDVLIYRAQQDGRSSDGHSSLRGFAANLKVTDLPAGAVVATSSTRRKAQLLMNNPGLKTPDIRGNVLTRIQKLMKQSDMDATVLALAGLSRLGYRVTAEGFLEGKDVPTGVRAVILDTEMMLPCVGQGAVGIEVRQDDTRIEAICDALNHSETMACVVAERAFLAAMGGGCQSPVAAYAEVTGQQMLLRARSFTEGPARRAELQGRVSEAANLGKQIAAELKG
jgi:hydroxymethylbilane synthase